MFAWIELAPSGGFWSRPDLAGVTCDDVIAAQENKLTDDRLQVYGQALWLAASRLNHCEPEGRC